MYIPIYFQLFELLPKDYYNESVKNWYIFDDRLLITLDNLRKKFGKATINDWHSGGSNQYRGWRPFDCHIGADLSQHKFGRGSDISFESISSEEVRKDIIKNPFSEEYKYITCIENFVGMSWVHVDCRNHNKEKQGLLIVGKG